jgi:ribulose-phosphate 3-epimerase
VLDSVDLVLAMTVNPGFGGQRFLESTLPKLAQIRSMIGNRPIALEVDGGITAESAAQSVAAGATVLVAGTSVFGHADRRQAIAELRG